MFSSFTLYWHNMSWILWFDDFNLFTLSLKQFGSDGLLKKSSFSLIGDRNTFIWAAAKESGFGLTVFIHSSLQKLIGYRNGGKIRVFHLRTVFGSFSVQFLTGFYEIYPSWFTETQSTCRWDWLAIKIEFWMELTRGTSAKEDSSGEFHLPF